MTLFPVDSQVYTVGMKCDTNCLALVKEPERYIFCFDDESSLALLQKIGEFAGNPDLSLGWYDAAVLSQKVRRLMLTKADARAAAYDQMRHPKN